MNEAKWMAIGTLGIVAFVFAIGASVVLVDASRTEKHHQYRMEMFRACIAAGGDPAPCMDAAEEATR